MAQHITSRLPAQPGDDLSPRYVLYVDAGSGNDIELKTDVLEHVKSVEYESSLEYADKASILIANPDFRFLEDRVLQPGNELMIYMGWGSNPVYIGRVVLQKHLPTFPREGMPYLEIEGYDRSYEMMEEGAEPELKQQKVRAKTKGQKKQPEVTARYENKRHSDAVREIAGHYKFAVDIDETTDRSTFVQKRGMSDYSFVRGLANYNERDFWVDYDPLDSQWVLHWKKQDKNIQERAYKFRYNQGEDSTLSEFRAEYGIAKQRTAVQVISIEPFQQSIMDEAAGDPERGEDPRFTSTSKLVNEITSGSRLRIAIGQSSVEVLVGRNFQTRVEAEIFAQRWARRRIEDFLMGSGTCVGNEYLRARQTHLIEGVGNRLSGAWFFSNVKHRIERGGGFESQFEARKIMIGSARAPTRKILGGANEWRDLDISWDGLDISGGG